MYRSVLGYASIMAGSGERIGEIEDSVAVGLRSGERELSRGARISEQPLTAAMRQRVDEQMQIVHQTVGQQRPDQGPAAADVDVAVDLVLEVTDRARAIGAKDRGVVPICGLPGGGDDVLGRLVHERRAWIFFGGSGGPGGGELLIGAASQQDRLARSHDFANGLGHLWIERVIERPGRVADNAIQRDELMHTDLAHCHHLLQGSGSTWAAIWVRARFT